MAGAEFIASFTPNFQMQNALTATTNESNLNSYMFNGIAAVPLGADAQWQPFVSGGFGAITLRNGNSNSSSSATTEAGQAVSNTFNPDETHPGGNIGFGIMGFLGAVGVRGDVRYFHAFNQNNDNTTGTTGTTTGATGTTTGTTGTGTTDTGSSSGDFLPGLNFWRANIGVAFRW